MSVYYKNGKMFYQTEGVGGDSARHRNVNWRRMKSLGDAVSGKSKRLCKTNETCRALKPQAIAQGSNPTNIPCNLRKSFFLITSKTYNIEGK